MKNKLLKFQLFFHIPDVREIKGLKYLQIIKNEYFKDPWLSD